MVQAISQEITFELPETFDATQAALVIFSIEQRGQEILHKEVDDIEPNNVYVYLTQEDTVNLLDGMALIQLNFVYSDESRACTEVVPVNVEKNLLKRVIDPSVGLIDAGSSGDLPINPTPINPIDIGGLM